MLNHNYVFFDTEDSRVRRDLEGYRSICTADLRTMKGVNLVTYPLDYAPRFIRLLFLLHHSKKINNLINLPFKSIWYPFYFKNKFIEKKPLCFIISGWYITPNYLKYLKKRYNNAIFVKIHRDLLEVWKKANPHFTDKMIEEFFDFNYTYDSLEAKKYGYQYFEEFESLVDFKGYKNEIKYDVFFAGKAKDRLETLVNVYDKLQKKGLRCYFYITGVSVEKRIIRPGIDYGYTNMPYIKMLQLSISSNCILEILQKGAVGFTSRFLEAVMYNKKLLTNNLTVKNTKFYNPQFIQCFSSVDEIDPDFILNDTVKVDYNYNNEFSPTKLIKSIDTHITQIH